MRLMNIYSKPGTKIRYAYPEHGMRRDQEQYAALLERDGVYTVKSCRAYDSHTTVVLAEVPDQTFNSVMFSDVTSVDELEELGGLTEAERAQLAADLRRIQDEMGQLGLRNFERAHVTDGSPCWCGPTTVNPDGESRIELANPIDEPVHFQVLGPPLAELPGGEQPRPEAVDGGGGLDPWGIRELRAQIEAVVERLRHTVQGPGTDGDWLEQKDVLDVEPFLDELGRIFSDRPANTTFGADSGPAEPPTAQIIDLMEALRATLWAEHVAGTERRERASARNEHTDGRVEGVDR